MGSELSPGDNAPDFSLPDQNGTNRFLAEFRGSHLILYFYPRDNTAGCTAEALAFTEVYEEMNEMGVPVIGISPDSPETHHRFIEKHDLKLLLLSDPDHHTIDAYGAWTLKKMYGKEYYGVNRSTFLINGNGKIIAIWRSVKVKGHVEEVTSRLREIAHKEP
mgnify:CR=1 FL=1